MNNKVIMFKQNRTITNWARERKLSENARLVPLSKKLSLACQENNVSIRDIVTQKASLQTGSKLVAQVQEKIRSQATMVTNSKINLPN